MKHDVSRRTNSVDGTDGMDGMDGTDGTDGTDSTVSERSRAPIGEACQAGETPTGTKGNA